MSLVAVTRKEYLDSIRSYTLIGLVGLFVTFTVFLAGIQWIPNLPGVSVSGDTNTLALLNSMRQPSLYLVPLVGIMVGYKAIAGERSSGSIRLILGLPNTRGEIFFGKLLGQTAVVSTAILVGYGAAALVALISYDSFALVEFGLYTLLTLLYALACVSIALGFSASTRSRTRALAGAITVYSVILIFWDGITALLQTATVGYTVPAGEQPAWLSVVYGLNPSTAFANAARAVLPEYREITRFTYIETNIWVDWYGFIVLGLWIVIPIAIGYFCFSKSDIE
ncbi:ABC transporter permease subunit [Halococcus thailandensis]|uniref:ABC-2 type transporter n=1 Tax=Halococcus thailandensis JCM 13552 TaxID=1227457 RepID=M0NE64_9EURY|nr:ABC transporter permease subunit [Halococcus thailandensis]EMA54965.1 ABC-2 type transporter [Halococcus thailandensis JCM 13552]